MPQEINPWDSCQEQSARKHLLVKPKLHSRLA